MSSDLKKTVKDAIASLPTPDEIRRRITENLQERLLLRRVLKLSEQREQAASFVANDVTTTQRN